jgi:hypothetical protein
VRFRKPSPSMLVALLALFVALGGSSYAALTLPRNSVGGQQLKKNAVTSPKVKPGSRLVSDFRRSQRTRLRGPRGLRGPQGAQGGQGAQGEQGPAGPFPGTLPSGATIRGAYAVSGTASAGEAVRDAPSFIFTLPADPTTHFIVAGTTPPAECPGTYNFPEAQPGHLCVYERVRVGSPSIVIDYPGDTGSARAGFIVQTTLAAAGAFQSRGTWAVTAP